MGGTPSVILENERLKRDFEIRKLPLNKVWEPIPHDLELENRQLESLLNWVDHYVFLGGKEAMITAGFLFPPVQPGFEPEADWKQFERWVGKRANKKNFSEIHTKERSLPPEWILPTDVVEKMLNEVVATLGKRDISFEAGKLPLRKAYECLRLHLRHNDPNKMAPGTVLSFG